MKARHALRPLLVVGMGALVSVSVPGNRAAAHTERVRSSVSAETRMTLPRVGCHFFPPPCGPVVYGSAYYIQGAVSSKARCLRRRHVEIREVSGGSRASELVGTTITNPQGEYLFELGGIYPRGRYYARVLERHTAERGGEATHRHLCAGARSGSVSFGR